MFKSVVIVFVVMLAGILFLPNAPIGEFVLNHIPISGDSEEAMDNFEGAVLLIKAALSAVLAVVMMLGVRRVGR